MARFSWFNHTDDGEVVTDDKEPEELAQELEQELHGNADDLENEVKNDD